MNLFSVFIFSTYLLAWLLTHCLSERVKNCDLSNNGAIAEKYLQKNPFSFLSPCYIISIVYV